MYEQILELTRQAHALTEKAAATATDARHRKKLVLADLSLHLVQAALRPDQPDAQELKRYLFSILTVADGFIPDVELKPTAEALLAASPPAGPAAGQ